MEPIEFDFMYLDDVTTHVSIHADSSVEFENFTNDLVDRAFGIKNSVDLIDVLELMERRCYPKTRMDGGKTLRALGLTEFSAWDIVKKTDGFLFSDCYWIRFPWNSDLTWKKLCERYGRL